MAELKTKKGKIVNCNILNEGYNSYIIEYNGKVGQVRKDRIVSMNSIDEAVLSKFRERVGKLIDRVKGWVQSVYHNGVLKTFFCTDSEDGENGQPIPIAPPGLAILAGEVEGLESAKINGYFPCEKTKKYAQELGIPMKGIKESFVNEGLGDPGVARAEADTDSTRIELKAVGDLPKESTPTDEDTYIDDAPYDRALNMLVNLYLTKATYPKVSMKFAPAFLGAPGNAKSSIVEEAIDIIRSKGYTDAECISCILSGGSEGTLFMASPENETLYDENGDEVTDEKWAKKPMAGIPAYFLPRGCSIERRKVLEDNANGLIKHKGKVIKEPHGGIFIIDEFTRSDERTMADIMNILSGNPFGTNCFIGNRWVTMVAGNRKKDMENLAASMDFALDSAQRTRLAIYNMIMTPETWLKWAKKMNKEFDYRIPNVLPEITQFIEAQRDQLYRVQLPSAQPGEYVNKWLDAANARSWQAFSNDLISYMVPLDPNLVNITCIRDLMDADPTMTEEWLETVARAHVGVEPARAFMAFLRTIDFGRDEALDVYATGTCRVKKAPVGAISGIVDRLAQCNPNYIADENAPADKLFTPTQLENVLNYMQEICKSASGAQGSNVGQNGVSLFKLAWRQFDDECVAKYSGLNHLPIILHYTMQDPNDPKEYVAKPGYENFVRDYFKFVSSYTDLIKARKMKGLE